VNKELDDLNNHTMPIYNFPDPFITCCFINEDWLFVNLYHNKTCTHYHFFYNCETKEIQGKEKIFMEGSSSLNFPYRCFYSEDENEVWSFYR